MNYLKSLRNEKGVSQQVVADYLGISRQAYSNYENEVREPDFETLLKLGEYFGCSVDHILRGPSEEQKNAPAQKAEVTDEDIKFALWGGDGEITDEMFDEVKRFAQFIKERENGKK